MIKLADLTLTVSVSKPKMCVWLIFIFVSLCMKITDKIKNIYCITVTLRKIAGHLPFGRDRSII